MREQNKGNGRNAGNHGRNDGDAGNQGGYAE